MKAIRLAALLIGLGAAAISASSAIAADETFDVTFTAHGFNSQFGQPAVDPVVGSFRITIDPTKTYLNETTGITLQSLDIDLSSPLSFDFSTAGTAGSTANELVVGGLAGGGACCVDYSPPTNDFWLQIPDFFTLHTFQQLGYSQSSTGSESLFFTDNAIEGSGGTVGVTLVTDGGGGGGGGGVTPGVPEPSTWAMMLIGFAGLGFAGLRAQKKRATAIV